MSLPREGLRTLSLISIFLRKLTSLAHIFLQKHEAKITMTRMLKAKKSPPLDMEKTETEGGGGDELLEYCKG